MEGLDSSYNIIGFLLVAFVAVWLILKSISLLFKMFVMLVIAGIIYFAYQRYPEEALAAGGILVVFLTVIWLLKTMLSSKK